MIRIAHVITSLGPGGAQRMLIRLAALSDRSQFEHLVISMHDDNLYEDEIRNASIRHVTLGMKRGRPEIGALIRLWRIFREFKPDIVQTWLYHADLMGSIAAKAAGVRVIGWNMRCSDMDLGAYGRLTLAVRKILAMVSPAASYVLSNSVAGRDYHASIGYRPPQWEIIFNGFDVEAFAPDPQARRDVRRELGIGDDTPLIGMLARYDRMKDYPTFLAAASIVAKENPAVHFLAAGNDVALTNSELASAVDGADLRGRIHLLGARRDAARIYAALDLHTLTSAYGEGFPSVLGEAMACGVPCVSTDVGDARTVVGDTGVIVPPRDPHALADAWSSILRRPPEQRRELGARARKRILDHFNARDIVRKYESFYASLATG